MARLGRLRSTQMHDALVFVCGYCPEAVDEALEWLDRIEAALLERFHSNLRP